MTSICASSSPPKPPFAASCCCSICSGIFSAPADSPVTGGPATLCTQVFLCGALLRSLRPAPGAPFVLVLGRPRHPQATARQPLIVRFPNFAEVAFPSTGLRPPPHVHSPFSTEICLPNFGIQVKSSLKANYPLTKRAALSPDRIKPWASSWSSASMESARSVLKSSS